MVFGVSVDSIESHKQFAANHELNFPLLSDGPPHPITRAYGVLRSRGDVNFASRSTFVIDAEGKIAAVFPEVKVDGHVGEVLAAVKKL